MSKSLNPSFRKHCVKSVLAPPPLWHTSFTIYTMQKLYSYIVFLEYNFCRNCIPKTSFWNTISAETVFLKRLVWIQFLQKLYSWNVFLFVNHTLLWGVKISESKLSWTLFQIGPRPPPLWHTSFTKSTPWKGMSHHQHHPPLHHPTLSPGKGVPTRATYLLTYLLTYLRTYLLTYLLT